MANETFFLHDPDNGDFSTFAIQAERDEAAKKLIEGYLEEGLWSDGVELIEAGTITHKVQRTNVRTRPDEDDEDEPWNSDADEICDYELLPVIAQPEGEGKGESGTPGLSPMPWSVKKGDHGVVEIVDADKDPVAQCFKIGKQNHEANAGFIVKTVNASSAQQQALIDTLEEIQLAVCYAREENIDSKEDMLRLIGEKARKALALFQEAT